MRECIIFDLDGTIVSIKNRVHTLSGENKCWDEFHKLSESSPQIVDVCKLYRQLEEKYSIYIMTGRNVSYENITIKWLKSYDIKFDFIFMRPNGDYSNGGELKREWLRELSYGHKVIMAIDDDISCINMFRSENVTTLQVKEL